MASNSKGTDLPMNDVEMAEQLVGPQDSDQDEEEDQNWDDWNAEDDDEGDGSNAQILCLFCDSLHSSSSSLFDHCASAHHFDFKHIRRALHLDFYKCFKLINYVRSKVAENRCWNCGRICQSKQDLQNHLHEMANYERSMLPWDDDSYLKPFLEDDALLYSFGEDDEDDDMDFASNDPQDSSQFEQISIIDEDASKRRPALLSNCQSEGKAVASTPCNDLMSGNSLERPIVNDGSSKDDVLSRRDMMSAEFNVSSLKAAVNEIKIINRNYFGGYSSFGIHREMISDKVRTDAYRQAILENPSLVKGAVVMDVGCGTGILSLFAAQAGASRVIGVDGSEKMAAVATQIAKDNGLLQIGISSESTGKNDRVIEIVHGMVEELVNDKNIQPQSVDVLISEWMGYCLLYESMLSSVLFARDRWLKPGGAILPDTASIFVAGFGRGGTSIPFWENVYGFNMSCVGKELDKDAAQFPIVDIIESSDVVTTTKVLQAFDLVTMQPEQMDFTAEVELELASSQPEITMCYGVVLWFETGFTKRFCKEMPTILSTSPYNTKTHWSQTILTFWEPVAMASRPLSGEKVGAVGTDACPAFKIQSRISIVRAAKHRSIDISLELAGIGFDGRKCNWPVQLFNLS